MKEPRKHAVKLEHLHLILLNPSTKRTVTKNIYAKIVFYDIKPFL